MRVYQHRISQESFISRIPALFPYIAYNSVGEAILHKATDNKNGCYKQIVQNMVLPNDVNLVIDGEILLKSNTEYSYRTLIDYYYQYVDDLDDDNSFRNFIETAIGRVKVTSQEWYNEDEHDLVPEYTYLALAKTQYNWFFVRKKLCDQYKQMQEDETHTDCASYYCCKCEEYERKGGDNMLELLKGLIDQADSIAEEYYGYAVNNNDEYDPDKGLTLNFHIILSVQMKDLGVMTPMELEWVEGDEYTSGDVVVYNNESYICTLNEGEITTGKYNEITERIEFDNDSFTKIKDLSDGELIDSSDTYGTKFKIIDWQYYDSDGNIIEKWQKYTEYNVGDYIVHADIVYTCITEHTSTYSFNETYFEEIEDYTRSSIDKTNEDIEFSGTSNSNLKSLRRFRDYINIYDKFEKPGYGEDWLYYYKIGVSNYRTSNDNLGNISFIYEDADEWESNETYSNGDIVWHDGTLYECIKDTNDDGYFNFTKFNKIYKYLQSDGETEVSEGDECYNLYAYGDVLTNISYEQYDDFTYKLIFEYVIGAHLKATYRGSEEDDDKNVFHYFTNFDYDETDLYHGVRYTETYYIDTDSDIYNILILNQEGNGTDEKNDTKFYEYINHSDTFETIKYEFDTTSNMITESKFIDNKKITFPTIISDFEATVKNEVDFSYSNVFRTDYLNGASFSPSKNVDVNIERGNAAAFEKHIKFGEIKTLEDLENYANGGFYNIEDNS